MDFTLQRIAVREDGCFSVLKEGGKNGQPFAVTLERTYPLGSPDAGVAEEINGQLVKIPTGKWQCVPRWFFKGGYQTYEILVPGHTVILFHKGNIEAHSEGCVLVGESFGELGGQSAILDSRGLTELLARINGRNQCTLHVTT